MYSSAAYLVFVIFGNSPDVFIDPQKYTKKNYGLTNCSPIVEVLGKGLSMLLPHLPILSCPLPDGTLLVVV